MKLLLAVILLTSMSSSYAEETSDEVEGVLMVSQSLKAPSSEKMNGSVKLKNHPPFDKLGIQANNSQVGTSKTELKYLNDVLSKAHSEDLKDLEKLLSQLTFIPSHKDGKTGVQVFKVTKVQKDSIFEKGGIKVGDLLVNGNAPSL